MACSVLRPDQRAGVPIMINSPVRIRPMTGEDLEAVSRIEAEVFPGPWARPVFKQCLDFGYSAWVSELQGEVAAYAVMAVENGFAHILNLAVHPEKRRKGLGRQLLLHLLQNREVPLRGAFLEVRVSNQGAIRLYRSLGFETIGIKRGYYPEPPEDALVLLLRL